MKGRKKYLLGFLILLLVALLPSERGQAREESIVIKIGYDKNSHFIREKNKEFYGYGVEYLNKIAEYTNWEYEYVNVENWQESFDKLRNGEIHFICTVHYTEDRAEEFVYSDIPLGYEATLLYAAAGSDIFYQDYEAFNGCKVGLLLESYSAEDFIRYAQKNQLLYEPVYFQSEREMRKALENNEIDLLAIGSRYGTSDLSLVDRLAVNAFYCISNQENAPLIEEAESVLQQIMFDDPTFEGNLNEKYFGHHSLSHTPPYTKEELAFINSLGTVKVKILLNQRPSCYEENGEMRGIWVEYLKLITEKCGIKFQMETGQFTEDAESVYETLLAQDYLVLRTSKAMAYNHAEGMLTSSPLMDIEISYIERQEVFVNDKADAKTVALTSELSYVEPMLLEHNPAYQFVYYSDSESCLEAVLDNKATMAIVTTYRASYLMQKPKYADNLTQVPGTEYSNQIHLVAREDQEMLLSIINKAISHISNEEKDAIVTRELLTHPYLFTFDDIWYQSWEWMAGILLLVGIFLIIYFIMTKEMARLQVEQTEYEILQKKIQLDELTGLYNRTYFYEIAKEMLENAEEEMCIIVMDICNFKIVNEMYGMNTGDTLLIEIADHLKKLDSEYNIIPARFMSDHYYMCVSKRTFEKGIFPKNFRTSLEEVDVHVVYGVFFVSAEEEMPVNVMCDRALLAAHGKQYHYAEYIHFYDNTEHKRMLQEQEIEKEMEKALAGRQFYIVVQPKYNPITEQIVGGEALVRWQHPVKGVISPGVFINVFEKNGFIMQLDYFVWEETCRLLAKRKKEGKTYVPISINVSRAHFYGSELPHKLHELIERYGLDTKDIELEITESLCGEGANAIYSEIQELQNRGFKIAMDDFGSGYSSLNMLKEMPLDIIKMDLRFLDGEEKKSRHILKALIEMAQTMELKVVVEGVEERMQVEFLRQFKDCSVQGYYFSRPVVTEEFERMLGE